MPRDFKEFARNNANIIHEKQEQADEMQDILNQYKDMDKNELMSNLFKEAGKLKKEGKLDANSLANLESSLSPFLNSEQKNMLKNIIDAIK